MKDIGIKLEEARNKIGITIEEAAEDMKVENEQISDVEKGNMENFKDIFMIKTFVRDYAKYLGLDKGEIVDEFNEYLFDYTSKLSLDEIKKEVKATKEEENKIKSPYTIERKTDKTFLLISYMAIFLLLVIIIYIITSMIINSNEEKENILKSSGGYYELS